MGHCSSIKYKCFLRKFLSHSIIYRPWTTRKELSVHDRMYIVWFQKLSIPPSQEGFFVRPPPPPGNSSQASYIYLNFWAFENPPTPQEFPIPSAGGVWIFSGTTHYHLMYTNHTCLLVQQYI